MAHFTHRNALVGLGAAFALQGVGWLVAPRLAAAGLGMPLLDGLGRSTQVGDFAAFFLTLGVSILAGSAPSRRRLLYFPAGLLASAAFGRMIAWSVHDASFATVFIPVEVLGGAFLFVSALRAET